MMNWKRRLKRNPQRLQEATATEFAEGKKRWIISALCAEPIPQSKKRAAVNGVHLSDCAFRLALPGREYWQTVRPLATFVKDTTDWNCLPDSPVTLGWLHSVAKRSWILSWIGIPLLRCVTEGNLIHQAIPEVAFGESTNNAIEHGLKTLACAIYHS